jgi:exopolysaccharide biosynthesis polyprenyl glycosylphosphotransferase
VKAQSSSRFSQAGHIAGSVPLQLRRQLPPPVKVVPGDAERTQAVTTERPATAEQAVPRREQGPRSHRRPAANLELLIILAGDCLVLLPLLFVAPPLPGVVALLSAMCAWTAMGLYRRRITRSVLDDLPATATGATLAVVPALMVGLGTGAVTDGWVLRLGVVLLVGVVAVRALSYAQIRRLRLRGSIDYPTLMVADGPLAQLLAGRIKEHPEAGRRLVGTLATGRRRFADDLRYLGEPTELARVIKRHGISDVVVGYGALPSAELVDVLRTCDRLDVEIYVVPRLFEMHRLSREEDCLWDIPLRRVQRSAHRVLTWRVKRLFDVCVSAAALAALTPLLAVTAAAVRLELGSGIIFRQARVGLDGHSFSLLKFRSMRSLPRGVESPWVVDGSDRLGRVGRFIRRYSIDELPQLINVLRGDMSIVGPRPERPEYVDQFVLSVPRYGHRHRVPVGLTGLAAVNGLRGDTSIVDRAQFDNWYIENWSLWLDMKIIARTALAVVRGTGS